MIADVLQGIVPKVSSSKTFTGSMLLNLTFEYIDAINTGGVPTIASSLERVISSEVRRFTEAASIQFKELVEEFLSEEAMPHEVDAFEKSFL